MSIWSWLFGNPDPVPPSNVGPVQPVEPWPQPSPIPPAPADLLGAATLPPTPHDAVVIQPKPALVRSGVPAEVFSLSEAFEAFKPKPYLDSALVWTIGIGSTRDRFGKPVTANTPPVTREEAELMAVRDLARAATLLAKDFPDGLPPRWWAIGVLMNNNLGDMSVWGATLLRILRAKQWAAAAEQMKVYRNAGGKPVLGLRRRRWAEAAYALGMDPTLAKVRAWAEIKTPDDWPKIPDGGA